MSEVWNTLYWPILVVLRDRLPALTFWMILFSLALYGQAIKDGWPRLAVAGASLAFIFVEGWSAWRSMREIEADLSDQRINLIHRVVAGVFLVVATPLLYLGAIIATLATLGG